MGNNTQLKTGDYYIVVRDNIIAANGLCENDCIISTIHNIIIFDNENEYKENLEKYEQDNEFTENI